jgi:hypothetical protein
LLFSGSRGKLDAFDCSNQEKTVSIIQHWLLIPVIQSTLQLAVKNTNLNELSSSQGMAKGETFTLSVLLIIKKSCIKAAAMVIEENVIAYEIR